MLNKDGLQDRPYNFNGGRIVKPPQVGKVLLPDAMSRKWEKVEGGGGT